MNDESGDKSVRLRLNEKPDPWVAAATAHEAARYEAGRLEGERETVAAIVRWLRSPAVSHTYVFVDKEAKLTWSLDTAIERGEWKKRPMPKPITEPEPEAPKMDTKIKAIMVYGKGDPSTGIGRPEAAITATGDFIADLDGDTDAWDAFKDYLRRAFAALWDESSRDIAVLVKDPESDDPTKKYPPPTPGPTYLHATYLRGTGGGPTLPQVGTLSASGRFAPMYESHDERAGLPGVSNADTTRGGFVILRDRSSRALHALTMLRYGMQERHEDVPDHLNQAIAELHNGLEIVAPTPKSNMGGG